MRISIFLVLLISIVPVYADISLYQLNFSQAMTEDLIMGGHNITGLLNGTAYQDAATRSQAAEFAGRDAVSIGSGSEYDIDIDDYTVGYQGVAIKDAISLAMTRTGNTYVKINIRSPINNTLGDYIYLNHTSGQDISLEIDGAGPNGAVAITSPKGIMVGNFGGTGSSLFGVHLQNLELMGGNSGSLSAYTGIDSNFTSQPCRLSTDNVVVRYYSRGIDMISPAVYDQVFRNVFILDCSGGFYLTGNANYLEKIVAGYGNYFPITTNAIYVNGNSNVLVSCDIGTPPVNSTAPNSGLYLIGDGNRAESIWGEPAAGEDNYAIMAGTSGYLNGYFTDFDAPFGRIIVSGNYNTIDCMKYLAVNNVTVDSGATENTIINYPALSTASYGVITDSGTRTAIPPNPSSWTAAPTDGNWYAGNTVYDATPVSGAPMGWICNATGHPGTWIATANMP